MPVRGGRPVAGGKAGTHGGPITRKTTMRAGAGVGAVGGGVAAGFGAGAALPRTGILAHKPVRVAAQVAAGLLGAGAGGILGGLAGKGVAAILGAPKGTGAKHGRVRGAAPRRRRRPAVIGKNFPSHRMITRLRRLMKKHVADAKTILSFSGGRKVPRRYRGYHRTTHRKTRR